jgi:hypothetical protein
MEKQVVSKKRVADHGEVLTGKREVNAMLDLVKAETERIDSRFLEPACGTGNFLTEVLERKLRVVERRYRKSQLEYERYSVLALSSIYGIDILEDNVLSCRDRLFDIFYERYESLYKKSVKEKYKKAARYILRRNIICGDSLTLMTIDKNPQPIIFSEWSFPFNDSRVKRRDYTMANLLPDPTSSQMNLFADSTLLSDSGEVAFIPRVKEDFPLVHFLKIGEQHD